MNIIFSFVLFVFLKIGIFSESKIVQFLFEKYKNNIADINSLKYYSSYIPDDFLELSKNDFMFRLLTDDVYFNLKIGSPPQMIPAIWNMNQYSFKIYNSSYNDYNSKTYKNISENFIYSFDEFSDATLCIDIFYFSEENNTSIKIPFKFINLKKGNKNYSFIGLQLPDMLADNLLTFIKEMKETKIINKYIFFISYDQNEKIENPRGNIFFGDYPHNSKIFEEKYKIDNFLEIKAAYRNKLAYWDILFDNIYFSENYENNDENINIKHKQAELLGNAQLSIGTEEYHNFIKKNFFNNYIKNNICEEKVILNITDYIYYRCKKSEKLNITKFPSLFFELKEINFNFSLDYNDLFFIHDDFIYFGILFDSHFKLKFNQRWKLGSQIFKKYLLVFNSDSKTIGFYNNTINKNIFEPFNNSEKNKNNYNFRIIIIILAIFLLFILVILIYRFIKRNINNWNGNKNYKNINYKNVKAAHDLKNKNEVHNYYELKSDLI